MQFIINNYIKLGYFFTEFNGKMKEKLHFWMYIFPVFLCPLRLFYFYFFLIFIFTFFYFTILYWFSHTLTWIHHGCTCVPKHELPFHLPPHDITLAHHHAPAPSMLYPASDIDWWFDSYMIVYMFQCHSPKLSLLIHEHWISLHIFRSLIFYSEFYTDLVRISLDLYLNFLFVWY